MFTTVLNNLAIVYAATNRQEEALLQMQQAVAIEDQIIGQVFLISCESQRMAHLAAIRGHLDGLLSLMIQYPSYSLIALTALDLVLRRKAIAAEAVVTQRDAIMSGRYPKLASRLAACRRERSSSHASRSASVCIAHSAGKSTRTERGRRQNRVGDGA